MGLCGKVFVFVGFVDLCEFCGYHWFFVFLLVCVCFVCPCGYLLWLCVFCWVYFLGLCGCLLVCVGICASLFGFVGYCGVVGFSIRNVLALRIFHLAFRPTN